MVPQYATEHQQTAVIFREAQVPTYLHKFTSSNILLTHVRTRRSVHILAIAPPFLVT